MLALWLVTLPEPTPFDAELAIRAAREAVTLDDSWPDVLNILAVVYYRTGQLDEAREVVQTSLRRPHWPDGTGLDWLVLTLIHARRGDLVQARACWDRAKTWYKPREDYSCHRCADEEPLVAEVEHLLGL